MYLKLWKPDWDPGWKGNLFPAIFICLNFVTSRITKILMSMQSHFKASISDWTFWSSADYLELIAQTVKSSLSALKYYFYTYYILYMGVLLTKSSSHCVLSLLQLYKQNVYTVVADFIPLVMSTIVLQPSLNAR